jgi:hypothetical protein
MGAVINKGQSQKRNHSHVEVVIGE